MDQEFDNILASLKRSRQELLDFGSRAETLTSEIRRIAERLESEIQNLEQLRKLIDSDAPSLEEGSGTGPLTEAERGELTEVGPLDAAFSILDSLMWSKKPKPTEEALLPKKSLEAAKVMEDLLASATLGEVLPETETFSSSSSDEIKQRSVDTAHEMPETEIYYSTSQSESNSSESMYEVGTILSAPSLFVKRQKMLESVFMKMNQLERKLDQLSSPPAQQNVFYRPKVFVRDALSRSTQTEDRKESARLSLPSNRKDASTKTSEILLPQMATFPPLEISKGSLPPSENEYTVKRTEYPYGSISAAAEKDAKYWQNLTNLILKSIVEEDVENAETVAKQLQRLPVPPPEAALPYAGEGYWATQANNLFKTLLKRKKCSFKVWNGLTAHSTLETALEHLTKDRKRCHHKSHHH